MNLFFHYCTFGFSNCYVLAAGESGGDALIVDPGSMDREILDFIEGGDYALRGILLTHDHRGHVQGLRTLRRIYDAPVYAINSQVMDEKTEMVKDADVIEAGSFQVEVFSVPGHSSDSAVYKARHLLFTGDTMTAGLVGSTASAYGAQVLVNALRSRILSLPGNYLVLPGHGPPSTLEAERRFNAGFQRFEARKDRRPSFAFPWVED